MDSGDEPIRDKTLNRMLRIKALTVYAESIAAATAITLFLLLLP